MIAKETHKKKNQLNIDDSTKTIIELFHLLKNQKNLHWKYQMVISSCLLFFVKENTLKVLYL